MRLALAAFLGISGACNASAFEFDGYRSGMSLVAARNHATQQGDTIEESTLEFLGADAGTNYLVTKADGRTFSLDFCEDRLFWLRMNIDGGLYAFATLARELRKEHGEPVFDQMVSPQELEPVRIARLSLTWEVEGEEIELSLASADTDLLVASTTRRAPLLCQNDAI